MTPRQVIEFQLFRLSGSLLRVLPLPTAQRLGAAVARRIFDRGDERVGYALVNLRIAFPELTEEERRQIGRESYVHFAWNVIDHVREDVLVTANEHSLQNTGELSDHGAVLVTRHESVAAERTVLELPTPHVEVLVAAEDPAEHLADRDFVSRQAGSDLVATDLTGGDS